MTSASINEHSCFPFLKGRTGRRPSGARAAAPANWRNRRSRGRLLPALGLGPEAHVRFFASATVPIASLSMERDKRAIVLGGKAGLGEQRLKRTISRVYPSAADNPLDRQ